MTDLTRLDSRDDDGALRAVVECPQRTRHKTHYVAELGAFVLGHRLPTGSVFPYEFGFIPGTLAEDGDPLDVLVLADEPTFPGCIIPIRLLGVLEATQQAPGKPEVRNDRLIAIGLAAEEFGTPADLGDLGRVRLSAIEDFFERDNAQQGKRFRVLHRRGPRVAERLVEAGIRARS
jgi:inorganic pyrophosphatase